MSHEDGELAWLPEDGVDLTQDDLVRIMRSHRALVADSASDDVNRVHVLNIVRTIERAVELDHGGEQ